MPQYIALLRGVNVGGNSLPMERLRALCTKLGWKNVRTYVQSGNVLFESKESAVMCTNQLEQALSGHTRLPVTVIIRKPAELKKMIQANPYPDAVPAPRLAKGSASTAKLYIAFLAESPSRQAMARLREVHFGEDQFRLAGREIYLRYADGYGASKMNNNVFEKLLDVRATTRNWNTVQNLYQLVANPGKTLPAPG